MADKLVSRTPRQLYRFLLRQVALLPKEAQSHYKYKVKQEFYSYSDEDDEERIQQIMTSAIQDAEWVLNKYQKK